MQLAHLPSLVKGFQCFDSQTGLRTPLSASPLTSLRHLCGDSRNGGMASKKPIMKKLIQTAAFGIPEFEMKPQANYRHRISTEHLCLLWALKRKTKTPITKLVAEALDLYLENADRNFRKGGENNEADA